MPANAVGESRIGPTDISPLFWQRVRQSPHRLLMLDYDGTLAPFRLDRSQAQVPPSTHAILRRLAADGATRIAIISGRRISDLERLLGPLPLELVGEHGWERRSAEGHDSRRRLPLEAARRLEQASRAARASGWGARLERKRCSLVLHTRGLPVEAARELECACERLWRTYYECDGLRLHRIAGGLTLRATARHKGTAVGELLAGSPVGTLPVYLGDDVADEDAFHELLDRGVAIHVAGAWRSSTARFHLGSADEVRAFLWQWEVVTRGAEDRALAGEPDASGLGKLTCHARS